MKRHNFNQKWIQWRARINRILAICLMVGISPAASLQSTGTISLVNAAPLAQLRADSPQIRKITPAFARLQGGDQVVIKGENFTPDTVVVVGDAVATNTQVIKGKKIKFTVPPQKAPGVRNLSVWTPNGIAQIPFQIIPRKLEELADGEITTIAGGIEYLGDGQETLKAVFTGLTNFISDSYGTLYIADTLNHRIRRIDGKTGMVTTIAGNGRRGFSGDGGFALAASLSYPTSIVLSSAGDVYFVDSGNQCIRKVDQATGLISRFAGNGRSGFTGDGNDAREASLSIANSTFNISGGIGFDQLENLLIADLFNNRIRRVDKATGVISTIAGNGFSEFSGDGGEATSAALCRPISVAVDDTGHLFIADVCNSRIRRVDQSTNIISTYAGDGIPRFMGDGGLALKAGFNSINSITFDPKGNLLLVDGGSRVRRIDSETGVINTIAGNGTLGTQSLNDGQPAVNVGLGIGNGGIGIDKTGNLLIVESIWNRIRSVNLVNGILSTRAGTAIPDIGDNGSALQARLRFQPVPDLEKSGRGRRGELTIDGSENLLLAETGGHRIRKINLQTGVISTVVGTGIEGLGQENQPATQTPIAFPTDLLVDGGGNLFISEFGNQRIRRVDVNTGLSMTVAGNGSNRLNVDDDEDDPEYRFLDDNGPAVEASIANPHGIAMDEAGNLFISHYGLFVRRVDAQTQIITTPLGCCTGSGFRSLQGIAVNSAGVIYVANANRGILRLGPGETQPTVWFEEKPFFDVAVSPNGAVFGVVMTEHSVYQVEQRFGIRIAGGKFGYEGDNGPATEAAFSSPSAVAIDGANNLYIVDSGNNAVRVIKNGAR